MKVFDAAEASSNTCCYASDQRQICGLTVRRSVDEGIWVGTTVGQTNSGKLGVTERKTQTSATLRLRYTLYR